MQQNAEGTVFYNEKTSKDDSNTTFHIENTQSQTKGKPWSVYCVKHSQILADVHWWKDYATREEAEAEFNRWV